MTPKKPTLPGDKIDRAKMAGHFKNKIQQIRTGGPRPVPGQTVAGPQPKPAGNPRVNAPKPTGPMVPVRGGGMAPASAAMTMKKGGSVGSASKRADGIATKGKTKGKIC